MALWQDDKPAEAVMTAEESKTCADRLKASGHKASRRHSASSGFFVVVHQRGAILSLRTEAAVDAFLAQDQATAQDQSVIQTEQPISQEFTIQEFTSQELTSQELTSQELVDEAQEQDKQRADTHARLQREQIRLRTGDSLAEARGLLKDTENIICWSRVLIGRSEDLQRQGQERRGKPSGGPGKPSGGQEALRDPIRDPIRNPTQEPAPSHQELTAGKQTIVVRLVGDINLTTSPRLEALLGSLASAPGEVIVLDLREVKFIDNSGFAALIWGRKTLANQGRSLAVLMHPGGQPERMFQIMSLKTIIRHIKNLDELQEPG